MIHVMSLKTFVFHCVVVEFGSEQEKRMHQGNLNTEFAIPCEISHFVDLLNNSVIVVFCFKECLNLDKATL